MDSIRQADAISLKKDHDNDTIVKYEIQTFQQKHIIGLNRDLFIAIHPSNHILQTLPICDSNWPTKTDIPCWNCEETFSTIPLTIPISLEPKMMVYKVKGNLCSIQCGLRYIYTEYRNSSQYQSVIAMFMEVCRRVFAIPIERGYNLRIPPNPKEVLLKYNPGSGITIDEYRSLDFLVGNNPISNPPFISTGLILQTRKKNAMNSINKSDTHICYTFDDTEMIMNNKSQNVSGIDQTLPKHVSDSSINDITNYGYSQDAVRGIWSEVESNVITVATNPLKKKITRKKRKCMDD